KGQKWDAGYQHTGYFLEWIETSYGEGSVRRVNETLMNKKYDEEAFWTGLFGKQVQELWDEYCKTLPDEQPVEDTDDKKDEDERPVDVHELQKGGTLEKNSCVMATPLDMASRHDLEDTFNAMRPHFEDKETEQNWQLREKDTAKLRRITVGNAPKVLKDTYQAGMKSLLEGIVKVINSLRTTLSASGCDLVQDMAKDKIPGIDSMAEIVLPHLVKLCASTKKIAAAKADATVNIIIAHISYNIFLMKLIWSACEDKNVQPRKYATGWLKTLVGKHRENKAVFEKGEGLQLFEKCLKKGLADSNPD
ncbi:MAG: hypothetical protein Q9181_008217, partial [Wetmoreana brouardii]